MKKIKEKYPFKSVRVNSDMYYFKDKEGTVWQVLKTPYEEIPTVVLKPSEALK